MKTEQQIEILKQALSKFGVPQRDYSLKGYSEDRICLDYNQEQWHVYMAERGHKRDIYQNRDADSAVMNFIDRLVDDETETKSIYDYYKSLSNRPSHTPNNEIKKVVHVSISNSKDSISTYPIGRIEKVACKAAPMLAHKNFTFAYKSVPPAAFPRHKSGYIGNKGHQSGNHKKNKDGLLVSDKTSPFRPFKNGARQ